MSGRAVARAAGINHQACAIALRDLEALGVLDRQGTGQTQLVRLNFDHYLVRELLLPLLRKERAVLDSMRRDIAERFRESALTLTIFGSVARGEDTAGSDLDILLVVDRGKRHALKLAQEYEPLFFRKYGVRLSPIVMTLADARALHKRNDPLLTAIMADGIDVLPRKLSEALG